ncbi:MAG: hypothetical protein ACREGB_04320 [Candidatus Saccharimonadales bacterium]
MSPNQRGKNIPEEQYHAYDKKLNTILNQPLTPDNIDAYANDALVDVIALVGDAVRDYDAHQVMESSSLRQKEDAALRYCGLPDVASILDHIANFADRVGELDDIILNAPTLNEIIIPTDILGPIQRGVGGGIETPRVMARLKSLLVVLEKDFAVSLDDPEQLIIRHGIVTETMMRRESYVAVQVPGLERLVLVCDEDKNMTYVFDTNVVMQMANLEVKDLLFYTKTALNDLLRAYPGIGKRIKYSNTYVPRMREVLAHDITDGPSRPSNEGVSYLRPVAPEGYLNKGALASMWNVSHVVINKVIDAHEDQLGLVETHRHGKLMLPSFSPDQQRVIKAGLEARGLFLDTAPENYVTIGRFARELKLGYKALMALAVELPEYISEIQTLRFCGVPAKGLSPQQQEAVRKVARERFGEAAPDGYISEVALAKELHLGKSAIKLALDLLPMSSVKQFRFGSVTAPGLSPEQRADVEQVLVEQNILVPTMPEGYATVSELQQQTGAANQTILRAVEILGEELGPTNSYRSISAVGKYSKPFTAYSPSQQALIMQKLEEGRVFASAPPDGYLSRVGMMALFGLSHKKITTTIDALSDSIGETAVYKFGPKSAIGYSPEQQQIIRQHLTQTT